MNAYEVPAGTVVVGVDGSPESLAALDWAADQAAAEHRSLTLAHALAPPPAAGAWLEAEMDDLHHGPGGPKEAARTVLTEARDHVARRRPELAVDDVVGVEDPRGLLMDLGEDAAMVVLGSRGRGPVRSLLLGSVGVALARHAPCPVVIHRPTNPGTVRDGVLVGVDGTERSAPVLEFAYRTAAYRDLPLTVVHCHWERPADPAGSALVTAPPTSLEEQRLRLAESVAGLGEKYPEVRVRTEVASGLARAVLALRSDRMNLVVLGQHHGGLSIELMFGSVTTDVVEHASCPVAVVPVHPA